MPSGPVLSEEDKDLLRARLRAQCEEHWARSGFRRTRVHDLCAGAAVSVGTFYALYPAKERLFAETIEVIQQRLAEAFLARVRAEPTVQGFAAAVKEIFREYDRRPLLHDATSPDFQAFVDRLPAATVERALLSNIRLLQQATEGTGLRLLVDAHQAAGVLGATLSLVQAKDALEATHDRFAVVDFIVDRVVPGLVAAQQAGAQGDDRAAR